MACRIEIGLKRGVPDARGRGVASRAFRLLGLDLGCVATRSVFVLDLPLSRKEQQAARAAFTDPVVERSALGRLRPPAFEWLIEVGFKPGVTDNVGRTAQAALEDILSRPLAEGEGVYTAIQYFVRAHGRRGPAPGGLAREPVERLARDLLANPLIQTIRIYSPDEWRKAPVNDRAPAVRDAAQPAVHTIVWRGADADLLRISQTRLLALNLEELRAIEGYFARPAVQTARRALGLPADPTDVEVECLAQTWSEHCRHKVFAADIRYVDEHGRAEQIHSLFQTYIKAATDAIARRKDWLVSVFTDNAGIIRFHERLNLVYKVETHNSPSALDPYGGAMTGIVGVNRDPLGTGMGAQLLANVWGYCLGSPFYDGPLPEGLLHPRRIRDGVHQGVIEGGNQSGLPWMRGWEVFDDRYLGKPLIFCGTLGCLPATLQGRPSERKEVRPGDLVVMAGGRIGKDGIHGATFSSEDLRAESPVQAVQIGDPITQRKLYEFILEARDLGLYRAITDNGAGGLSCSVGEMGQLSGGVDVDLSLAPLKYQGLQPWEIFVSEAQERMTLAVPPDRREALLDLARRRDVEAAVLGTFTDSGQLIARYRGRIAARLDMDFLYAGCPVQRLEARWTPPVVPAAVRPPPGPRTETLLALLADLNLCSKEFKSRQYDGEVKGLSVVKPFVGVRCDIPGDASLMRADYERPEGVLLAEGINPFYGDLDPYAMTASAVDEGVRRIVSAGGDPERIAGLDNFCWPDPVESERTPDGRYKLAQLVRACRALYDATTGLGVPCISGKDSVKNDSTRGGRTISIPPTVLFSTVAPLEDVRRAVTLDFKRAGDWLYAVGLTRGELGASAFVRLLARRPGDPGRIGGTPPRLDLPLANRLYRALHQAARQGLLASSHTPTRGGWAVALAFSALAGDLGADVDITRTPADGDLTDDERLFSESNSRFLVTVTPDRAAALETLFAGLPCARIGHVRADRVLCIRGRSGRPIVRARLPALRNAFKDTLYGL